MVFSLKKAQVQPYLTFTLTLQLDTSLNKKSVCLGTKVYCLARCSEHLLRYMERQLMDQSWIFNLCELRELLY
jgi:hypothetical protein